MGSEGLDNPERFRVRPPKSHLVVPPLAEGSDGVPDGEQLMQENTPANLKRVGDPDGIFDTGENKEVSSTERGTMH